MKLLLSGILTLAGGAAAFATPITSLHSSAAGLIGMPVATAVPEPSTIVMFAAGGAMVVLSRFRRKK